MIYKNAFEKIKTNICRHLIAKSEKCLAKRRREECVEDRVDARVGVRQHVASDLISGLVDFLWICYWLVCARVGVRQQGHSSDFGNERHLVM